MVAQKTASKKTSVKRATTKTARKVGRGYECRVCGLSVTVDEDCGCLESHDIICCGTPMKKKRTRK